MLANTTDGLDNTFIDQQLNLASVAIKANDKVRALDHYQSAYDEALWLCEHYIDHVDECDASSARRSYENLSALSKPLLKYTDSPERAEAIKSQLLGVSMRVSSEFGVDINSEILSDVTCGNASLMPIKLNFLKSVFA